MRAQRVLDEHYAALRDRTIEAVARRLSARGLHRDAADIDGAYHDAWCSVLARLSRRATVDDLPALLCVITYRRTIDEVRRTRPGLRARSEPAATPAVDDRLIDRLDERRRLREFAEGLRDELHGRSRTAAELCYVHGHRRSEAAEALGLTQRRMKKVMDEVSPTVARLVREIDGGERCAAHASRNHAFALGVLDPAGPRHASARAHLGACQTCRADVRRIHEQHGVGTASSAARSAQRPSAMRPARQDRLKTGRGPADRSGSHGGTKARNGWRAVA